MFAKSLFTLNLTSIITLICFLSLVPTVRAQKYNPLQDVFDMTLLTLIPLFIASFQALKNRIKQSKNEVSITSYKDLFLVILLTGLIPNVPLFIRPLRNGPWFFSSIFISYTILPIA